MSSLFLTLSGTKIGHTQWKCATIRSPISGNFDQIPIAAAAKQKAASLLAET